MSMGLMVRKFTYGFCTWGILGCLAGAGVGFVAAGVVEPAARYFEENAQWAAEVGANVADAIGEDIGQGLGRSFMGAILGATAGSVLGAIGGGIHRVYYGEF